MLTNQQITAIDLLADPSATQKDVAAQIGVHQNTVTNWMKSPEFQTELRKSVVRHRRRGAPKVLEALEREATKGNAAAAKIYLQAVGYLDNRERLRKLNNRSHSRPQPRNYLDGWPRYVYAKRRKPTPNHKRRRYAR